MQPTECRLEGNVWFQIVAAGTIVILPPSRYNPSYCPGGHVEQVYQGSDSGARRRVTRMILGDRQTWALSGAAVLALGIALFSVRGRSHSAPPRIEAEIRTALMNRDWSRAEELLRILSARRPPTSGDVVLRAELEVGRGRLDESIGLLTGIPEGDPLASKARLVAGQIEKSRSKARAAESLFLEAVRLDPALGAAHRELMLLYATQARRAEVNERFRILEGLGPLSYEDVFLWTTSFEDLWVNETIRAPLERFVSADPADRLSRLALAGIHLRSQQFDEARSLLESLPVTDPDAQVLRARIALAQMQLDGVASILESSPGDHLGTAILRAHLASRRNDPATAAREFRVALRQDPMNHEALLGLSLVLKQLGDAKAVAPIQAKLDRWHGMTVLLQKARTFNIRNDKALLTRIGEDWESLGQAAVARAWYRLALSQDPLDSALQQALFRLRDEDTLDVAGPGTTKGGSR